MKRKKNKPNKKLIFIILLIITLYIFLGPVTLPEFIQGVKNVGMDIQNWAQKRLP